ncbi:MAG: hypothetical protein JNM52_03080 [Betaproteobacteria bacterium]|nr:hypothetical protein [Betaproteobacteria bacterium]
MKKYLSLALSVLAISAGTPAYSQSFYCSNKIGAISLNPAGTLTITYGYGWHYICNINGTTVTEGGYVVSNASKELCNSYYNLFLTAKALDKKINVLHVPNSRPNPATSCETLGSFVWPNPSISFIYMD